MPFVAPTTRSEPDKVCADVRPFAIVRPVIDAESARRSCVMRPVLEAPVAIAGPVIDAETARDGSSVIHPLPTPRGGATRT